MKIPKAELKVSDEFFMRHAIRKAHAGIKKGQTPFGACVVKNNKIVACVHNEVWQRTDITAHAEMQAIRKACKTLGSVDLKGCTIYSTCEPCPMCFAAIHWANMTRIVFGAEIQDARRAGFNELSISNRRMKALGHSKVESAGGLLKEENAGLFRLWKESEKARTY